MQHALRAYTPKDQKALKAAAQSFRANPAFDTETAIAELETGEALISFLDEKGAPAPVERAFILPPQGQIGPLDQAARDRMVKSSLLYRHYAEARDRESAFEMIADRQQNDAKAAQRAVEDAARKKEEDLRRRKQEKEEARRRKAEERAEAQLARETEKLRTAREKEAKRESEQQKKFWVGTAKSVLVPIARQVLGSLFKRR